MDLPGRELVYDRPDRRVLIAQGEEVAAVAGYGCRGLVHPLLPVEADLARLDVEDPGSVHSGGIGREREAAAVGEPSRRTVLRADPHLQYAFDPASVRVHDVDVLVLQLRGLVARKRDFRPVRTPDPAVQDRVLEPGERGHLRSVRAELVQVQLAVAVGQHCQPGIVRGELDRDLLRLWGVSELGDGACTCVDCIQVVLLVPVPVLGKHDRGAIAAPDEPGPQRPRYLAVAHLAGRAVGQLGRVQLHPSGLIPVERESFLIPSRIDKVETRQARQFFERYVPFLHLCLLFLLDSIFLPSVRFQPIGQYLTPE